MKKIFLLAGVSILTLVSMAQGKVVKADLIGTWKPVSINMGDGAMKYDFTTETMVLSDSLRKSFKSAEDSSMAVGFITMMFASMGKMSMTFKEPELYIEKTSSGKQKEGTFTYDEATSTLITKGNSAQTMVVTRANGQLCFEGTLNDGNRMLLYMKKE